MKSTIPAGNNTNLVVVASYCRSNPYPVAVRRIPGRSIETPVMSHQAIILLVIVLKPFRTNEFRSNAILIFWNNLGILHSSSRQTDRQLRQRDGWLRARKQHPVACGRFCLFVLKSGANTRYSSNE